MNSKQASELAEAAAIQARQVLDEEDRRYFAHSAASWSGIAKALAHLEETDPSAARRLIDEEKRHLLVAVRAHAIWIEEGRPEGQAKEHWLRAEKEIEQSDIGPSGTPPDHVT
jgi:hypothetical protein